MRRQQHRRTQLVHNCLLNFSRWFRINSRFTALLFWGTWGAVAKGQCGDQRKEKCSDSLFPLSSTFHHLGWEALGMAARAFWGFKGKALGKRMGAVHPPVLLLAVLTQNSDMMVSKEYAEFRPLWTSPWKVRNSGRERRSRNYPSQDVLQGAERVEGVPSTGASCLLWAIWTLAGYLNSALLPGKALFLISVFRHPQSSDAQLVWLCRSILWYDCYMAPEKDCRT